jgi:hypothetical protein
MPGACAYIVHKRMELSDWPVSKHFELEQG